MIKSIIGFTWFVLFSSLFLSCATPPKREPIEKDDPQKVLAEICAIKTDQPIITGNLWLKLQSREVNGQFPAVLRVTKRDLSLEVTNLVGGREALIKLVAGKYTIEHQGKKTKGKDHWGGIPLQWAIPLFMGQTPCFEDEKSPHLKAHWGETGELVSEQSIQSRSEGVSLQKLTYRFMSWSGKRWVNQVLWEKDVKGNAQKIEFNFMDPDLKTGTRKRWSAISEQGEVHIRLN